MSSKKYERKSIVYRNGKWYEVTYYYDKTVTVKELEVFLHGAC